MKFFLIFLSVAFLMLSCGEDAKDGTDGVAGSDGTKASLLKITTEAKDTENCSGLGGTKIEAGIDENENEILDEDEVDSIQFICNGSSGNSGENGTTGNSSLINITDESEGTENCDGNGGKKIESGIDDNEDGILDADEVDNVDYICNDAEVNYYYGDYYIRYTKDILALEDYDVLIGNLYISPIIYNAATGEKITELILNYLKGVTGSIYIENDVDYKAARGTSSDFITKVSFLNMEYVKGAFLITDMNALTTLELPKLKEVGESASSMMPTKRGFYSGFTFSYNNSLVSLDLSKLEKGSIFIYYNNMLKTIDLSGMKNADKSVLYFNAAEDTSLSVNLSNLESVGSIQFYGPYFDNSISFPNLVTIYSSLSIENSGIAALNFPKLAVIGEYLELGSLTNMKTISFPELINMGSTVRIYSNSMLEKFECPKVEKGGTNYFDIENNETLSECTILDFINSFNELPQNLYFSSNKSCKYYEYNTGETGDFSSYSDWHGIMANKSWSFLEKMIIPTTKTDVVYPHLYRGLVGNDAAGNFKITANGVAHSVTAEVYNGTSWISLTGTGASVKPGAIVSVIFTYDIDIRKLFLYVNGVLFNSADVDPIDDSANTSFPFVAVSNDGTDFINYVPYGFLHHYFITRALNDAEVAGYTTATADFIDAGEAEYLEINFMDGATIDTVGAGSFSYEGSPVRHSVLDVLDNGSGI